MCSIFDVDVEQLNRSYRYCVRPNSGMIPAGSSVDVQGSIRCFYQKHYAKLFTVLLQAMKEDPPLDAKCKDKFLVQSTLMSADDGDIAKIWQSVEKTKGAILEQKIRVNFLPAGGAAAVNGVGASSHHDEDHPPAYSSPSPQFGSPAAVGPATSIDSRPAAAKSSADARSVASNPAEQSTVGAAVSSVTSAIPASNEELKSQLADAKAQIAKLTSQMGDSELRQRKIKEAGEAVQTTVQQTSEQGVPLQIVAGLCLLSFLIAYIFF